MPATLQDILLAPDTKPKVIEDCYALIQQEVSDKSGISGTAVKLAYKTVNTFMPGHIRNMVGKMLPEMVDKLEPFWADFNSSGGSEFGDYLAKRGDEVAQALLSVTDRRAAESGRPTIVKAYKSVRGSAASTFLIAPPRTVLYALRTAARLDRAARASVTDSSASDTSGPRLAR